MKYFDIQFKEIDMRGLVYVITILISVSFVLLSACTTEHPTEHPKVERGATTASSSSELQAEPPVLEATNSTVVEIKQDQPLQIIEGFGSCFNELGWTSLNSRVQAPTM